MFKWDEYQNLREPSRPPSELRHAHLEQLLAQLQAISPETMSLKILGESYEGRLITCATLGKGPHRILAWSQMHGNEPTHTAALLDLIGFLQRDQQHDTARVILEGCTVSLVLMLNPDGAERYQRRNAQDLDINRDAMHLASPEGRILHELVESIRPHFALNLHNQNPRTAVGVQRPQPAAVSLLVPPIDAADNQTEATQRAKQLASVFLNAVKPHCPEMISRYDADFMPRCFGEWVQQQGVATLTVEAGGWTGIDATPLVRLHFLGLIHLLEAIATNSYLHADSADYDALPRSSEHYLFDLLISGIRVVNNDWQDLFVADLGINQTDESPCSLGAGGKIEDMGDLHLTTGKTNILGDGLLCLPGRIVYQPDFTPRNLLTQNDAEQLIRLGVTTLIGRVDCGQSEDLKALEQLTESSKLPLNLGFVAGGAAGMDLQDSSTNLWTAITCGVLGILDEGVSWELKRLFESFSLPIISVQLLPCATDSPLNVANYSLQNQQVANLLKLPGSGRIQLNSPADLILLKAPPKPDSQDSITWNDLQQVIVAGRVVFDCGTCEDAGVGKVLKSHLASS